MDDGNLHLLSEFKDTLLRASVSSTRGTRVSTEYGIPEKLSEENEQPIFGWKRWRGQQTIQRPIFYEYFNRRSLTVQNIGSILLRIIGRLL